MPKQPTPRRPPKKKPNVTGNLLVQLALAVDAQNEAIERIERAIEELRSQLVALLARLP